MAEDVVENIQQVEQEVPYTPRNKHHTNPNENKGRFFALRQILNIVFMVGAIVAVILVLVHLNVYGMIVAVIAMAFKMAECVFRYIK